MPRYKMVVTRYDEHPMANQVIPYEERRGMGYSGYGDEPRYPMTVEVNVLSVELSLDEYNAAKAAILEVVK